MLRAKLANITNIINITNITNISYARISTNNTAQLSSLGNQFKRLNGFGPVITHVGSGSDEFPEELKNKILAEKGDVRLNIVAFDRLTRNFRDLDFLLNNVKYLFVLDENKLYDVKNDLFQITTKVIACVQELELIRKRCSRRNAKHSVRQNFGKKNTSTQKRCQIVSQNLAIPEKTTKNLIELIKISQNLDSLKTWNSMFTLIQNLGAKNPKNEYSDYWSNHRTQSIVYKLPKADLTSIISTILKKHNINQIFIRQFINCYLSSNN